MGVNLIPLIGRFKIQVRTFEKKHCAVKERCTKPGKRKLLRFDYRVWNAGNKDLHIGDPTQRPRWFEYSDCHKHYHLKGFNQYTVFGSGGGRKRGQKQGFCLEDTRWKGPVARKRKRFNCDNQGVSAGWYDLYSRDLDCQWVDITDLPDGDYVLQAETNPKRRNGRRRVREDNYTDNVIQVGLRITGRRVKRLAQLPFSPA
ncbi:MAG TPA: lysyl oxidase family protein [Gemmatimonadales bacterium]|nr:lysyl oxidase family protein [Gemmatimonadales bacterium]